MVKHAWAEMAGRGPDLLGTREKTQNIVFLEAS